MSQLSASAVFRHASTAARFGTGRTPGRPRQTSHTYVFGGAFSGATAQPQNIFVFVFGWTWTSMPITTSQSLDNRRHLGANLACFFVGARHSKDDALAPLWTPHLHADRQSVRRPARVASP